MPIWSPFGFALVIGSVVASAGTPEDWPMSAPSVEGLNPDAVVRLDTHVQVELPHLRSLLIARHGRLVFEKYQGDATREGLHNMQSMSKSVSSALVGITLRKGLITSLDNRVLENFRTTGIKLATSECETSRSDTFLRWRRGSTKRD